MVKSPFKRNRKVKVTMKFKWNWDDSVVRLWKKIWRKK